MTACSRGLPIRLCLPMVQSILCIRHRPHLASLALIRWHFALCFRQPSHERRCCVGWIEGLRPRSSRKTSRVLARVADMGGTRESIDHREVADGWLWARKGGWGAVLVLEMIMLKSSGDGSGSPSHDVSSSPCELGGDKSLRWLASSSSTLGHFSMVPYATR